MVTSLRATLGNSNLILQGKGDPWKDSLLECNIAGFLWHQGGSFGKRGGCGLSYSVRQLGGAVIQGRHEEGLN